MPTADYIFNTFDMFGSHVPRMTINGKSQVGTGVGFCATVLVAAIMIGFGTLQIYIVFTGANPQISRSEAEGAFISGDERLDLTDDDFFFAFSILDSKTKEEL